MHEAPDQPPSPADDVNARAAAVLERVFKNAPFVHGSKEHPQFLNDLTVKSVGSRFTETLPGACSETLVIKVKDPHFSTIYDKAGEFLASELRALPPLKDVLAKATITISRDDEEPTKLKLVAELPAAMRGEQAIAAIAALDPPHTHFAKVDSVELVGTSPRLSEANSQAIEPLATELIGLIQYANRLVEQGMHMGAEAAAATGASQPLWAQYVRSSLAPAHCR